MGDCPCCGAQMLPLFTGFFCPNDCDREREFEVEEVTADFGKGKGGEVTEWTDWLDLSGMDLPDPPLDPMTPYHKVASKTCQNCNSTNTGPFTVPNFGHITRHCIDCGHTW
jgi:hypothetical protein